MRGQETRDLMEIANKTEWRRLGERKSTVYMQRNFQIQVQKTRSNDFILKKEKENSNWKKKGRYPQLEKEIKAVLKIYSKYEIK